MTERLCRHIVCCLLLPLTSGSALAQVPSLSTPATLPAAPVAGSPGVGESPVSAALLQSPMPGVGGLFKSVGGDFQRLPSRNTATVLTVGAAAAFLAAKTADHRSSHFLSQSATFDEITEAGATMGGARLQLAGALATYGVGRLTRSPKAAMVGADLLRAQLLAQAVTAGIKLSARRTRPDGTNFSFPSGHTSVTFASATVLHRDLGPKVGIPAYAVATYVAASRIQDRRHFLSDVAFGAALGIVAGRTVTVGHGGARFAMAPAAVPGGGGVSFNWLGAE